MKNSAFNDSSAAAQAARVQGEHAVAELYTDNSKITKISGIGKTPNPLCRKDLLLKRTLAWLAMDEY